jgi:hypothetical protein
MTPDSNGGPESAHGSQPPSLARDAEGRMDASSVADIIEWFIERDARVNMIRHPRVEEIFQWKQAAQREAGEEVYEFASAEERLALGVYQALVQNASERELHAWIGQLLNALDEASKTNEEVSHAYGLDTSADSSPIAESAKIPAARGREVYLTCCWLEALCTAEVRVLGWLYQELYGRPFQP